MPNSDRPVISLTNETTASRYLYAVSPAIKGLVMYLPPERLSAAMPQQTPYSGGYEQTAYATALVELAHEMGIEDADISVTPLNVPDVTFETGWVASTESEVERIERLFPHKVSIPVQEVRAVYKRAESLYELTRLIKAMAFGPTSRSRSDVTPYGFGMGNEVCDAGRLFFTAYDATECGDEPDEGAETFATYMVYGTKVGDVVFERIHVGKGLEGAEDCRIRPSSIDWEEGAARAALGVWKNLAGTK